MNHQSPDNDLATFITRSRELIGRPVKKFQWNTSAGVDAIRHFAQSISDNNPLWLDPDYAATSPYGRIAAPSTFLASAGYPILHGAPQVIDLASLIDSLEYRWYRPILADDRLQAIAHLKDIIPSVDRLGRTIIYIVSHIAYTNQDGDLIAEADSALVRMQLKNGGMLIDRQPYSYGSQEKQAIDEAILAESRTGSVRLSGPDVQIGQALPPIVRGPLTIGDLICWNAAIGPGYRPSSLGYRDRLAQPDNSTILPGIGWPVAPAQMHEDPNLAGKRGMPAPFDNGVMRFACVSLLLTNWMGDHGFCSA